MSAAFDVVVYIDYFCNNPSFFMIIACHFLRLAQRASDPRDRNQRLTFADACKASFRERERDVLVTAKT